MEEYCCVDFCWTTCGDWNKEAIQLPLMVPIRVILLVIIHAVDVMCFFSNEGGQIVVANARRL